MSVHLITGYKGTEHIQSKDARSFNMAMFGNGEFVMEIGNQLEGSIINNNTIRILDGDILMQGGHIRIETDTYEDLTITTGTAGKNRIDLIVMTYERNNSDGTEDAYLEVIKGTESAGTASDPEYISGVISEGALKNQMPLYRVKIEGVVLSKIESLFTTIPTYKKLAEQAAAQYKATINALKSAEILDTMEEIEANTQGNLFAGALALKEGFDKLNSNLSDDCIRYPSMSNLIANMDNTSTSSECAYTATENCWAYFKAHKAQTHNTNDCEIFINGKVIATAYLQNNYESVSAFVPLKKGDVIKFNTAPFYKQYSIYGVR